MYPLSLQGLAYDFTIQLSQSLFVQRCSAPKMATMSQIRQSVTKSMTRQKSYLISFHVSGVDHSGHVVCVAVPYSRQLQI